MFATADYNPYRPDEDQYPDEEEDGQEATSPRVVYDRTNLPRADSSADDSSKPQQRRVPQQQQPPGGGGGSGGRVRTPPEEHATQPPQSEQGQPRNGGGSAEGGSAEGGSRGVVRERRELPGLLDPRGRFRSR